MTNNVSPCSVATEKIAMNLDAAVNAGNLLDLKKYIKEAQQLAENEDIISKATIYYCIGTAYGEIDKIGDTNPDESIRKQMYFSRKSLMLLESVESSTSDTLLYVNTYKTKAYINYGNALCKCGRLIAAIAQYKMSLELQPTFGMALGNLGQAYLEDYVQ